MRLYIFDNNDRVGEWTASYVAKRIVEFRPSAERPFVLGLPTGFFFVVYMNLCGCVSVSVGVSFTLLFGKSLNFLE